MAFFVVVFTIPSGALKVTEPKNWLNITPARVHTAEKAPEGQNKGSSRTCPIYSFADTVYYVVFFPVPFYLNVKKKKKKEFFL